MPHKELPILMEQQQNILDLVYKFRFINRKQLQEILGHKDARRINTWLKDLVEKKYLGRIYSHKLLENTKPAIYFLENNAIIWCKINMSWQYRHDSFNDLKRDEVKKLYATKKASETFINRCIFIADLYLQILQQEKADGWHYDFTTKIETVTSDRDRKDYADKKQYVPDVFIEKINEEGDQDVCYYLEYFDPHAPLYAMRYKIRQYISLHEQKEYWDVEAGLSGKFPKVLVIIPNQVKANKLAHFIQETLNSSYDVEDITFCLTTTEKITKKGIADKTIWKQVQQTGNTYFRRNPPDDLYPKVR